MRRHHGGAAPASESDLRRHRQQPRRPELAVGGAALEPAGRTAAAPTGHGEDGVADARRNSRPRVRTSGPLGDHPHRSHARIGPEPGSGHRGRVRPTGVTNIIRVPYEPSFATGERIVYDRLLPSTTEAYTNVAAEIADSLAASVYGRAAEYADAYAPEQIRRPPEAPRRAPTPRVAAYREFDPERYREPTPEPISPKGRLR